MRALLRVILILIALPVSSAFAKTPPRLADLPPPVQDYAAALTPYCQQIGSRTVVANGLYSDSFFGALDINGDGRRDYIIYKCMFGCDGEPYALQGLGPGCMFGSLLLSSPAGYHGVPIPGQLLDVEPGPQMRVAVYREHIQAADCDQWYCSYVFELRDGWFRLMAPCPGRGCKALLSSSHDKEALQQPPAAISRQSADTVTATSEK